MDSEIGRLLQRLRSRGLLDRTLVVAMADHGESLGEHGERTHEMLLYEAALRVPVVVRAPGRVEPARRTDAISLADIAPTLLDLAGAPPLRTTDGVSL